MDRFPFVTYIRNNGITDLGFLRIKNDKILKSKLTSHDFEIKNYKIIWLFDVLGNTVENYVMSDNITGVSL